MALQSKEVLDLSFAAGANFATKQYLFVVVTAANTVSVVDSTTDNATGVLQDNPPAGKGATVRVYGVSKVVSDGSGTAISVWDPIRSDTTGKAVKASTGEQVLGRALSASSASGTVIDVLLTPNGGACLP